MIVISMIKTYAIFEVILPYEKSVQSLQHERSCLQKELKEITSRRNDVEGDLSKANEECHRLSSELEKVRASMKLLE